MWPVWQRVRREQKLGLPGAPRAVLRNTVLVKLAVSETGIQCYWQLLPGLDIFLGVNSLKFSFLCGGTTMRWRGGCVDFPLTPFQFCASCSFLDSRMISEGCPSPTTVTRLSSLLLKGYFLLTCCNPTAASWSWAPSPMSPAFPATPSAAWAPCSFLSLVIWIQQDWDQCPDCCLSPEQASPASRSSVRQPAQYYKRMTFLLCLAYAVVLPQ